jgi:hypothetical protein
VRIPAAIGVPGERLTGSRPARPVAGGTNSCAHCLYRERSARGAIRELAMNGLIYLIGLIVVIMIILSFLGLR